MSTASTKDLKDGADRIALVDLDSTVADYSAALSEAMRAIQHPSEEPYTDRYEELTKRVELPYVEARRKMIQRVPGFWRSLKPIALGFDVVEDLRRTGFQLHVLTKGPRSNSGAWAEKLEWSREWLPDAVVTVTAGDKGDVYGRVLVDDFPPYFMSWLENRPRGLVVCVAHEWNAVFARGGSAERPNVVRYDGKNRDEITVAIQRAYERASGEAL
jgi:5'(3')-deoxyribonucleotidase